MRGWIGYDLDGTLAEHKAGEWKGPHHVGAPIPLMIAQLRKHLDEGWQCKIMTARAAPGPDPKEDRTQVVTVIQDWLEAQGLPRLEVTNQKDYGMVKLYDDRATQVIPNTGICLEDAFVNLQAEFEALKKQVADQNIGCVNDMVKGALS